MPYKPTSSLATAVRLALLLLILFTGGCGGKGDVPETLYPEGSAEVEDSLKSGNLDFANSRIRDMIKSAPDSDNYIGWRVVQGVSDYYSGLPDSLRLHTSEALGWFNRHEETPQRLRLKARALQTRAGYYTQFTFDPDSCLHYQREALATAERLGDPRLVQQTTVNLGDTYKMRGDLEESARSYRRSLQLADSLHLDRTDYVPVVCGLAAVYTALGNYKESRRWWDRAGEYWDVMMAHERFNYLNNRGNDWYLQKEYTRSLGQFMKLQKYLADNGSTEWERHFCEANLADVLVRIGRDIEARPYIESNLEYFSTIAPNQYTWNHVLTQAMRMHMNLGDYAEVDRLIAAYPLERNIRSEQWLGRYEFLNEYYARRGEWKKAYEANDAYRAMDDSIRNSKVRLSISELDNRYAQNERVLTLQSDIEEHRARMLTNYVIIAVAVALCAILFIIILVIRSRSRRGEARMHMRIMNLKMDNLKRRITPHFIYNSINQEIIAREKGLPDNLETLVSLLRRQQQLAADLSNPIEEELEFVDDYIRVEGQKLNGKLRYTLSLSRDLADTSLQLPSMAVQIFVENAFKHGFPSLPADAEKRLEVSVTHHGGKWEVSVWNNSGDVTPPATESTHEGLRMVMQTIALLNERNTDSIELASAPCHAADGEPGFKATISIPENYDFYTDR